MKNGIVLDSLSFGYEKNSQELNNINLEIVKGSFCGIVGTNGSGKSTLTLLLNGLIPHEIKGNFQGNVYIDGVSTRDKPITYFAKQVGMVFQDPDFMLFNLSVREEIEFGLKNLKLNNQSKRIVKALEAVGMEGYEDRDPQTLSFGQKQKIALASILALDTPYIVLDEPVSMLDYPSAINIYEILKSLNREGKTIIVVEHDTDFLKNIATQMVILDKNKVVLAGTAKDVFSETQKLKEIGIKIPH